MADSMEVPGKCRRHQQEHLKRYDLQPK